MEYKELDLSTAKEIKLEELNPETNQPTYDRSTLYRSNRELSNAFILSDLEKPIGQNLPEGGSKYINQFTRSDFDNPQEALGRLQSTTDKWLNAAGKMGILAATTTLDGIIGTVVGLGAIAQDGKLSSAIANPFTKSMMEIQEWSEKMMPNYYTQEEQDSAWYDNLGTANFWADKVMKNFGFAIGAYTAGALTAGASSYLSGASKLTKSLGSQMAKGYTQKLLSGGLDEVTEKAIMQSIKSGKGVSDDLVKGLISDSKKLKNLSLANQVIGSVAGSMSEARIEANHGMKEFVESNKAELDKRLASEEITEEEYNNELKDIESKSLSVGNHIFGLNVALLSAGNYAQFRHAFSGGYARQAASLGKVEGSIANKFLTEIPKTKLDKALALGKAGTIGFKNALVEGFEEMNQRVASEGMKDYFRKQMSEESDGYINTVWNSFKDTYGNVDNWEEFVIGAFSGGVGIPTIIKGKPAMAGGIVGDIREEFSKQKRTQGVVDAINKAVQSDAFKNMYYSTNADLISEKDKENAIKAGDKFEFKNAEDLQINNLINTFYNAGKIDQLYDWIEGMGKATAEEIKGFTTISKEKDSSGKLAETPDAVSMFENWKDDDIVNYHKERAKQFEDRVRKVVEIREAVDVKFGSVLSDEGKTALSSQLAMIQGIEEREESIHKSLTENNNFTDGREATLIAREASNLLEKPVHLAKLGNIRRGVKGQVTKLTKEAEKTEILIKESSSEIDTLKKQILDLDAEISDINVQEVEAADRGKKQELLDAKRSELSTLTAKLNKNSAKLTANQDRLKNLNQEIAETPKQLEEMLEKEYEARTKIVEKSPELYENISFEEYRNRVLTLTDRIDAFEESVKESYEAVGKNPIDVNRKEKIQGYLKDLAKLSNYRENALNNYISSVKLLQNDIKAFESMQKEVYDELLNKKIDSKIKRVLSGAKNIKDGLKLFNKENGEEVRVEEINGNLQILTKNEDGTFTKKLDRQVDKDFISEYFTKDEYTEMEQRKESVQAIKDLIDASQGVNGLSIKEDKVFSSGKVFIYKHKKKDIVTDQDIVAEDRFIKTSNGTVYKIYGEGDNQVLGSKKYSESYFKQGEIVETDEAADIAFDGEIQVDKVSGNKFLVRAENIPELDALFEAQQKTVEDSENQVFTEDDLEFSTEESAIDKEVFKESADGTVSIKDNPNIETDEIDKKTGEKPYTGKPLLVLTSYSKPVESKSKKKVKDKDGKLVEGETTTKFPSSDVSILDTKEGREALARHIKNYAEENNGADLMSDIYDAIRKGGGARVVLNIPTGKDGKTKKYFISLPQNPPKKVIVVGIKSKGKDGKVKWDKPKTITSVEELKNLKIKKSKNGTLYTMIGGKFHIVKSVDRLGDNAKFRHWKYRFTALTAVDDGYSAKAYNKTTEKYDKDVKLSKEEVEEFIKNGIENVDYIKTDKGYKIFRSLKEDEDTSTFSIGNSNVVKKFNKDVNRWEIAMSDIYEDNPTASMSGVEKNPRNYKVLYKGNKIGIKRQLYKQVLTDFDGTVALGAISKVTYKEEQNFLKENEIPDVTESSDTDGKLWDAVARIPFEPGILFATTFAGVNPVIGSKDGIDEASIQQKNYNAYLNKTNLKDGEHKVRIVLGPTIGNTEFPDSLAVVIVKKFGTEFKPVDINGEAIDISEVHEKGVYSNAPLPERFSVVESKQDPNKKDIFAIADIRKLGEDKEITVFSYKQNKAKLEKEIADYKAWVEATVAKLKEGKVTSLDRTIGKVTTGHNLVREDSSEVPSAQALEELFSDPKNFKIIVGIRKAREVTVNGQRVTLRPGFTYAEDLRTGNIFELQTNKLNKNQVDTVVELLKKFVSNFSIVGDGKVSMDKASTIMIDGNNYNIFKDGIENIVFFQDRDNLTNEAMQNLSDLEEQLSTINYFKEPNQLIEFLNSPETSPEAVLKLLGIEKEEILKKIKDIKEGTKPGYKINSNPKTQLYLSTSSKVPGGMIVIGGNILPLLDQDALAKGNTEINPKTLEVLTQFLSERRINVVSNKLGKNDSQNIITLGENGLQKESIQYEDYVIENTSTTSLEHSLAIGEDKSKVTTINKKVVWISNEDDIIKPVKKEEEDKGDENYTEEDVLNDPGDDFPDDFDPFSSTSKVLYGGKDFNAKNAPLGGKQDVPVVEDDSDFTSPFRSKKFITTKQLEDFDKFKQWIVDNLGDDFFRDFVKIEDIVDEGNWGEFTDNLIILFKDAELGTGYHEAFHAIKKMLLPAAEYNRMAEQFKTDPRFKERLAQVSEIYKGASEEYILEEAIAEEFREYVLSKGKSLKAREVSKAKGVFGLLKRLFNYITGANRDLVSNLFYKINKGNYKSKAIKNNTALKSLSKKRKKVISPEDKYYESIEFYDESMQSMSVFFFKYLFDESFISNGVYKLFGKGISHKLLTDLYNKVKEAYENDYEVVKRRNQINTPKGKAIKFILDNFEPKEGSTFSFTELHKNYLSKYKLEEVEDIDQESMVGRSESGSQYNASALKTSAKANSSGIIKALVGGIVSLNSEGAPTSGKSGLFQIQPFGKVFSILINKLSNTTSLEEKYTIMKEVAIKAPEINMLIKRLKLQEYNDGVALNFMDMDILMKFNQTFSKNTNKFTIALIGAEGAFTLIDANIDALYNRVEREWKSRFNTSSNYSSKVKKVGSLYYYNSKYFSDKYKDITNRERLSPAFTETFLQDLGIYAKELTPELQKTAEILYKEIISKNVPVIFSSNADTDLRGRLAQFVEHESNKELDYIENSHYDLDQSLVYNNTVNSPINLVFNKINSLRKEFGGNIKARIAEEFPHLNPDNVYNRHSVVLRDLSLNPKASIEISIHHGNRIEGEGGKSFNDFSNPERLYTWYKMYKQGKYVLIRPSDNSIERFINFNGIKLNEVLAGRNRYVSDYKTIFLGYLIDEMEAATDLNNFKYKNFANNRFNNIVMDMIRIQSEKSNDILYNKMKTAIETNSVQGFINTYQSHIKTMIGEYMKDRTQVAAEQFKSYKMDMDIMGEEVGSLTDIVESFVITHYASAIEQTKIITGNLAFAKDLKDMYKRNSSVANTKKITSVGKKDSNLEKWIRNKLKRIDKLNPESDMFWFKDKPVLRTIIINDVEKSSSTLKELQGILGARAGGYSNQTVTDGSSIASIEEIRELLFRAGDWNQDLEDLRNYEISNYLYIKLERARKEGDSKKEAYYKNLYTNFTLKENEDITNKFKSRINSLKPQYRGPLAVEGFVPTVYKTSFTPLIPSMFMNFRSGKTTHPNLETLFDEMIENSIGIVSFYSANKGMTTIVNETVTQEDLDNNTLNTDLYQPLYYTNEDGVELVNTLSDYIVQPTFYEFWGIQVDTGFKTKNSVVYGTQMLVHLMNGLYKFGKPASEALHNLVNKYKSLNNKRIELGVKELIEKIGLSKDENGKWTYNDNVGTLIDTLMDEAVSRDMPDNFIDQIETIETLNMPLDALVNSDKMKTILYSIADKLTLSQKAFGKAPYQIPSTLFEQFKVMEDKKGVKRVVSENLKFYGAKYDSYESDGITPTRDAELISVESMEVLLPSYLKGIYSVDQVLDKELLTLVGFRIPTQGLNSIESIRVKGFLSDTLGDVIVLPEDIVTKSGSDFDIDKLNIYIPHFFKTKDNKYKYINDKLSYKDYLELVTLNEYDEDYSIEGKKKIKVLSKLEYDKKQIENQLLTSMNDIITHPDNARQLLNPIDSDDHKNLIKTIQSITGAIYKTTSAMYGDVMHHLQVAKQNMEGAGGIGIAANAAKFAVFAAMHDFRVSLTSRIIPTNPEESAYTINNRINLPHNKDELTGEILLGGLKDALNDKYLYDIFNAYVTLTVDNGKDPVLDFLNSGLKTINTVLYLAMAGVPYKHIHYFMTQPIIMKYVENMAIYESDVLKSNSTKRNRLDKFTDEIVLLTLKEFTGDNTLNLKDLRDMDSTKEFTLEELGNMLKADPNDIKNEQVRVLMDFIRYQEVSKELTNAIRGMQFDTKGIGRGEADAITLEEGRKNVINRGVILNYEKAFEKDNSFMGVYQETLTEVTDLLSPFSVIMQNSVVKDAFTSYIAHFFKHNARIGQDRIKEAARVWQKDFLSYLLLSKPFKTDLSQKVYHKPIGLIVDNLFKGESSLPSMITEIQNIIRKGNEAKGLTVEENNIYKRFKDNILINSLSPSISPDNPIHGLSMVYRKKDSFEADKIAENWRNLLSEGRYNFKGKERNIGLELGIFAIAQSGIQNSPVSFVENIPFELYTQITKSVLDSEITIDDVVNYTVQTLINNYSNDDMVKKVSKKALEGKLNVDPLLYPLIKTFDIKPEFSGLDSDKITALIRKGVRVWNLKPTLYTTANKIEIPDFGNYQNHRENVNRVVYGTAEMNTFIQTIYSEFLGLLGNNEVTPALTMENAYTVSTRVKALSSDNKVETNNTQETYELSDGNFYTSDQINSDMLIELGYTQDEAGEILKDICN
jgi:hypothetical protein